ncbi:MAG: site-2 protease family protein [Anaerolineales bacterium]
MDLTDRFSEIERAVSQVMQVDDVTHGRADGEFVVRFRGRLVLDSEQAYERLAPVFHDAGQTLLFREEEGRHIVLGVAGVIEPGPSNPWTNLVMFILTLLSVILAGALFANIDFYGNEFVATMPSSVRGYFDLFIGGIPFAIALLAILLSHEFGHYLAGRYHKTAVTLPYFIPLPGSILGTLGAVIRMKEPPRNRKILLDIGLAGPLAGFVVALPILLVGLSLSHLTTLPAGATANGGVSLEGNSILYLLAKYVTQGQLLPAPVSYGGGSQFVYWLRYFFLGRPIPFGGLDVLVHPLAWAGWAGMLVTALNLIPAGQLDGGHLIYVLFGKRASRLWIVIVLAMVGMGFVWTGWWIWAALIFFLGRSFAQPLDEITPLDGRRRALAILGLVVFVLTFTPVPLLAAGGGL